MTFGAATSSFKCRDHAHPILVRSASTTWKTFWWPKMSRSPHKPFDKSSGSITLGQTGSSDRPLHTPSISFFCSSKWDLLPDWCVAFQSDILYIFRFSRLRYSKGSCTQQTCTRWCHPDLRWVTIEPSALWICLHLSTNKPTWLRTWGSTCSDSIPEISAQALAAHLFDVHPRKLGRRQTKTSIWASNGHAGFSDLLLCRHCWITYHSHFLYLSCSLLEVTGMQLGESKKSARFNMR